MYMDDLKNCQKQESAGIYHTVRILQPRYRNEIWHVHRKEIKIRQTRTIQPEKSLEYSIGRKN